MAKSAQSNKKNLIITVTKVLIYHSHLGILLKIATGIQIKSSFMRHQNFRKFFVPFKLNYYFKNTKMWRKLHRTIYLNATEAIFETMWRWEWCILWSWCQVRVIHNTIINVVSIVREASEAGVKDWVAVVVALDRERVILLELDNSNKTSTQQALHEL